MYALIVSLKKILIGKVPLALNLSRCFLFFLPTLDVEIQAVKEEGKNKEILISISHNCFDLELRRVHAYCRVGDSCPIILLQNSWWKGWEKKDLANILNNRRRGHPPGKFQSHWLHPSTGLLNLIMSDHVGPRLPQEGNPYLVCSQYVRSEVIC